jgi:hypothetical protein
MRESSRLWAVSAVSADTREQAKEATTRAEATTDAEAAIRVEAAASAEPALRVEAAIRANTVGTPRRGMASDGVHLESWPREPAEPTR